MPSLGTPELLIILLILLLGVTVVRRFAKSAIIASANFKDTSQESLTTSSWSGCQGDSMSPPEKSQTTRLLCASAFLNGSQFREKVLGYLESESHGVSPELGVDIGLVAMVCQYAKIRTERFYLYLFLALVASLIVLSLDVSFGLFAFALSTSVIYYNKIHGERVDLASKFREENFNAINPGDLFFAHLDKRATSALPRETQNLIVYTGFAPFAGAGMSLGGWSFTVDISKSNSEGADRCAVIPFKVEELYGAIDSDLLVSGLKGLVVKDCYFVSGREIRQDHEILPNIYGRPNQQLTSSRAQRYLSDSDTRVRHYRWVRVHEWSQELVVSCFLRLSIRGNSLFIEMNRFLLTPLADEYRRIDEKPQPRLSGLILMAIESLFAGPVCALFASLLLLRLLSDGAEELLGWEESRRRRTIDDNLLFNYGSGYSLRHRLSSTQYEHYFQKTDSDFIRKTLESTIIDKIVSFLNDHHVDTSNLRERQTMILNSGIIVHGGDVKAENLAVGSGAQASMLA